MLILVALLAAATSAAAFSTPSLHVSPQAQVRRHAAVNLQVGAAAMQLMMFIGRAPDEISFQLTMDAVEELYEYSDVPFSVGDVKSAAGESKGSAKVFSFGKISNLDAEATLQCFGDFYRKDVLENPDGTDHANIRAFMKGGWDCVEFPEGLALKAK